MGPETRRPSRPLQNDGRSRSSFLAVLMVTTKPSPSLPPDFEMLWLTMPMTSPAMLNIGPAGVARVDGGVGLEELGEGHGAIDAVGGPLGADPARAHRVAEPVGRSDDEDLIADPHRVRVGQESRLDAFRNRRELEQREVGGGLRADHARENRHTAEELDVDLVHRMDDVSGRHDLTVGRDEYAGPDLGERREAAGALDVLPLGPDHDYCRVDL